MGAGWAEASVQREGGSWAQKQQVVERKHILCGQALALGRGQAASILPRRWPGKDFLSAVEYAINGVIFLVFCLFPRNGLMDVNNYQTIKASKCAIFYRSKSSNK